MSKKQNPADKVEQWPIEKLVPYARNSRTALLMELDPRYCDVIVKRWQEFTGKQAIHAETGQPFAEVKDGDKEAKN